MRGAGFRHLFAGLSNLTDITIRPASNTAAMECDALDSPTVLLSVQVTQMLSSLTGT